MFDDLSKRAKALLQSGVLWAAVISWLDPELRRWAEESAITIRKRAAARGVTLSNVSQKALAERIWAALRGVFERLISERVASKPLVVLLEKAFNDIPDFMASVLFSDEHEFEKWQQLRAESGRSLIADECVPVGDVQLGERLLNVFYSEVRGAVVEIVGAEAVIPDGLIERHAAALDLALQAPLLSQADVSEPMTPEAGSLKGRTRTRLAEVVEALERAARPGSGGIGADTIADGPPEGQTER